MTGRLCGPFTTRRIVQWEEPARLLSRRATGGTTAVSLIFAMVGTDHHPFHRLVDWMDEAARRHPDTRFVVQHGDEQGADPRRGPRLPAARADQGAPGRGGRRGRPRGPRHDHGRPCCRSCADLCSPRPRSRRARRRPPAAVRGPGRARRGRDPRPVGRQVPRRGRGRPGSRIGGAGPLDARERGHRGGEGAARRRAGRAARSTPAVLPRPPLPSRWRSARRDRLHAQFWGCAPNPASPQKVRCKHRCRLRREFRLSTQLGIAVPNVTTETVRGPRRLVAAAPRSRSRSPVPAHDGGCHGARRDGCRRDAQPRRSGQQRRQPASPHGPDPGHGAARRRAWSCS